MNTGISSSFNDPWQEDVSTSDDYANILIDQMNCLYLLSFLITANMQAAERCFSKALDEYVEARGGFMEWVEQHGRRAVLRHAVHTITPVPSLAYNWSIEGISEEECAALLNCSVQDVAIGRELARAIVAVEDLSYDLTGEMDLFYMPTTVFNQRCGIC